MEAFEALPSISRLSKTVTRILGQNPGKFTLQGTNTYLIGEHNPYILIDTGEGKDEYLPQLQDALSDNTREFKAGEQRISDIILTHKHHDHTHGLPSVLALLRRLWDEQTPAPASPYKPPRIHKIPLPTPDARLSALLESLPADSYTPSPGGGAVHDLSDGDSLKVTAPSAPGADAVLRIIHTPGHTADSLCIHYPPDRALFTADTVLGHGTAVFEELGPYMASLKKMIEFAQDGADGADGDGTTHTHTYETVYPGHGPVVADGLAKVTTYLKHRVDREEQIVRVLRQPVRADVQGASADGWTTEALVATIYAKYPKDLWAPAAHSVELHLGKLVGEGRAEKAGAVWVLLD